MSAIKIETNENGVTWYKLDGETYGVTLDGRLLDCDGIPYVDNEVLEQLT